MWSIFAEHYDSIESGELFSKFVLKNFATNLIKSDYVEVCFDYFLAKYYTKKNVTV